MKHRKFKISICSGYFDPLHIGHLENLNKAKELGDLLIVIINNKEQAILKKGYEFMTVEDREQIIKNIKGVDATFISVDNDASVKLSLRHVAEWAREIWDGCELTFCKGGDRTSKEIPEREVCKKFNIKVVDGLGKKIRSSSDFITRYKLTEQKMRKAS